MRAATGCGVVLAMFLAGSLALGGDDAASAAPRTTVSGTLEREKGERASPLAGHELTLVQDGAAPRTAVTDGAGRFEFADVVPGRACEVRAAAEDCEPVRVNEIVVLPGETRRIGDLTLGAARPLTVQVLDEHGDALPGAAVELFRQPEGPLAEDLERARVADLPAATHSAVTGEDGVAEFRLAAQASWTVVASAKGRARVARQRLSTQNEDGLRVELVAPPAHRLTGRVLGTDGRPVAHALVAARRAIPMVGHCATCDPPPYASPLWTRADADAEGRFAFDALPPGTIQLLAGAKGGSAAIVASAIVPDISELDVTLGPAASLAGRAVDDETGAPVPGVTVAVRTGFAARLAVTGADGCFLVDGLETRGLEGFSWHAPAGCAPQEGWVEMPRRTVLHEGETATAEIRVHRSATVTGRALRGGAPVGGADITVVTLGAALRDRRGMVSTHAAADGAFVVRGIVPGRLVVYAKAPEDDGSRTWDAFSDQVIESAAGRAAFAFDAAPGATVARDVEVRPSPPPKEPRESLDETVRDLVADEGRITVTGRITTADGRDLVEARVLAAGDAEFVGEMFAQNLARPVGAGGRFRIEGRVEGDSIAVRAADLWHDATTVIAKVPAGAHEVKVDLVLPARPVVRGSVTSGGNPVAGAFIGLGDGVVGRTAADGTFAVPAKSGAAWLSVRAPGFVSWLSRELKVPVEEPLQIELSAALAISGVVVDEKDAPVAGAVVTARRQEREEAGVATGADGAFRIAGLAPGSWTLRVAASPGAARDLAAKDAGAFDAGASKVRIVAHAGRRISGTFVGADGAGIASAKVTCRPGSAGEEEAETRTDAAGRFEFAGLSAGTFAISADPTSDDDLAVVHAETKSGGDPLLLRATAAPVVAGVLVDDAGKPVAGVELEAQRLDGDDEGWWSRPKAKTGADGKFRIVVKDGDRFRVALPRNSRVGDSREIVGGDDVPVGATDVKLVAKRLGGFDGIAVDPDGKPVAGVKVTIHVRHQDVEATSGEDGTFRIAPLGDWTGTLIARAPGRAPVQRFGVKPGAGEIRLEMKPEARFAGRLVEADGTAATHWTLRFVSPVYPGTDLWRVTPGPDGRFDVGEMCPGDWYAEAISTESKESVSLGKVTPGTTDAVLRLP